MLPIYRSLAILYESELVPVRGSVCRGGSLRRRCRHRLFRGAKPWPKNKSEPGAPSIYWRRVVRLAAPGAPRGKVLVPSSSPAPAEAVVVPVERRTRPRPRRRTSPRRRAAASSRWRPFASAQMWSSNGGRATLTPVPLSAQMVRAGWRAARAERHAAGRRARIRQCAGPFFVVLAGCLDGEDASRASGRRLRRSGRSRLTPSAPVATVYISACRALFEPCGRFSGAGPRVLQISITSSAAQRCGTCPSASSRAAADRRVCAVFRITGAPAPAEQTPGLIRARLRTQPRSDRSPIRAFLAQFHNRLRQGWSRFRDDGRPAVRALRGGRC